MKKISYETIETIEKIVNLLNINEDLNQYYKSLNTDSNYIPYSENLNDFFNNK